MKNDSPLRTVPETAEILGVSQTTMWVLIRGNRIATIKIPSPSGRGRRHLIRIEQSAIDAFIKANRQPAAL
jgi:predicted DNA-binding transcriptional regulator AlpA